MGEPTTSSASTCGDTMDTAPTPKRQRSITSPPVANGMATEEEGGILAPTPALTLTRAPAATAAAAAATATATGSVWPHVVRDTIAPLRYAVDGTWREVDESVLVHESFEFDVAVRNAKALLPEGCNAVPVVAFDLESAVIDAEAFGTGIDKKKRQAPEVDEFVLRHEATAQRFKEEHEAGKVIVLLSNQSTVGGGGVSNAVAWLKRRVRQTQRLLDVPLTAYLSLRFDRHRMPSVGMWEHFKRRLAHWDLDVDESSIYVGARLGLERDKSSLDYKFACNAGLDFRTPERFYEPQRHPPNTALPTIFQPRNYVTLGDYEMGDPPSMIDVVKPPDVAERILSGECCLVLLCGGPCTGKTTFMKRHLAQFACISNSSPRKAMEHNSLRSLQVRPNVREVLTLLAEKRTVVVDGTHFRRAGRLYYVGLAKHAKAPIYCLHFNPELDLIRHLDVCREILTDGKHARSSLSVFQDHLERRELPQESEGYDAPIGEVSFRAHFLTNMEKVVFTRFT